MNSFYPILKKELLELVRSKKILMLIIVFAFVAISSPILAKLIPTIFKNITLVPGMVLNIPESTWRDSIDQFIKNTTQFVALIVIFLFAGSVAEEKTKKTLELVLTKPISRRNFILAKFASSFFAIKVVFILFSAVFYLYTISIFGAMSLINFVWLSVFLLILILLIDAITIFFSTISANQLIAVGLSFLVFILIMTLLPYISAIEPYAPGYIINHYKDLMSNGEIKNFVWPAVISVALTFVAIFASVGCFKKQEIER